MHLYSTDIKYLVHFLFSLSKLVSYVLLRVEGARNSTSHFIGCVIENASVPITFCTRAIFTEIMFINSMCTGHYVSWIRKEDGYENELCVIVYNLCHLQGIINYILTQQWVEFSGPPPPKKTPHNNKTHA